MSGAEKQGREGEGERGRESYSCIMYVYTSTAWMAMATMYNGVAQYVHVCAVCVYTVMLPITNPFSIASLTVVGADCCGTNALPCKKTLEVCYQKYGVTIYAHRVKNILVGC